MRKSFYTVKNAMFNAIRLEEIIIWHPHSHFSFEAMNPIINANLMLLNCLVFFPTLLFVFRGSIITNSLC